MNRSVLNKVITCVITAALLFSGSLVYVDAYSSYDMSGLDVYIATDLLGQEAGEAQASSGGSGSSGKSSASEEPVLEAGAGTFAEALAQQYRHMDGKFTLSETSRFYIVSEERPGGELLSTVQLMDSQFAAYGIPSETPLPVVYGSADLAEDGDIVISLADRDEFKQVVSSADIDESYRIDVYGKAAVEACSADGIWYGLIELLEIAKENKSSEKAGPVTLDFFRIKDGPDLKERAIMLDCGRKYYSKDWIENLIRRASLQRYNALVLHFAEAEGIRLDSEVFPWLTDNIDSLSTEEMTEIVRLAHQYHMEVIPSFDTPGHNRFMVHRYAQYVRKHPAFSFTYDGRTYDKSIKGFGTIANHYSHGGETESAEYIGIDLTRGHAVAFTDALIDGYADFFGKLGCDKIDIGSDEMLGWYTFDLGGMHFTYDNRWKALDHWKKYARKNLGIRKGSANDVFISYINELAERLEKKGYTCRVFNDEIDSSRDQHVELKESIEITYWFDGDNTATHYADTGHVVHNFMESWCFYVLRQDKGGDIMKSKYRTVNARNIFKNWDPRSFARKAGDRMRVPADKLGGGYFAVWCDSPDYKDAHTVWKETELRTWANASRMWNAEVNSRASGIRNKPGYEDMKEFALNMDGFPGFSGDPEDKVSLAQAPAPEEVLTRWQRIIDTITGE